MNGCGSLGGGPGGGGWGIPVMEGLRRLAVALRRERLSDDCTVSRGFEGSDRADAVDAAVSLRDVRDARLSGLLDSEVDDRCLESETSCR